MIVYKLVVLGGAEVGKTALTLQLLVGQFLQFYEPTIEDVYQKQVAIDGEPCKLEILDTGWEYRPAFGDQWIKSGEGFILVYSVTSRESFQVIRELHSQIWKVKRSTATGYLDSLRLGNIPVMIVGCKNDRKQRAVSYGEGTALAGELGCKFAEVSAESYHDVEKAFYDVARWLRSQRQQGRGTCHDGGDPRLLTKTVGGSTLLTEDKRNCRFYLTAFSAIRQFFTRLCS